MRKYNAEENLKVGKFSEKIWWQSKTVNKLRRTVQQIWRKQCDKSQITTFFELKIFFSIQSKTKMQYNLRNFEKFLHLEKNFKVKNAI